jgi:fructose-1,6-bisphosphatase/inositol monophosphatase family enzyme
MASLLICNEAGVAVREIEGRDPVVREHAERRTLVVAATPTLVDALFDIRVRHAQV